MPKASLWRALVGVDRRTVIEDVEFDEAAERVMVHVRPRKGGRGRCGRCGRWSGRYDRGEGRRRWRALDLGTIQVHLEAAAPRVRCREHGPTVARLPWARHGAGHTLAFDDTVAWLAVRSSKSAVCELMRIAWRTVGAIVARVWADAETQSDRFGGLRRIGIDEISYKKHHRYLTVVVDHDTGRLVWAAPGRDSATLNRFFDALGERRAAEITHVSADAAQWIADTVARRAPKAIRCADPFHVVAWATEALDAERRRAWNDARALARTEGTRRRGRPATDSPARPGHEKAKKLKDSRYALWKNPEDLTENQQAKLAWIATTDRRLYRAYLLKEGLRYVFTAKGEQGKQALDRWTSWARRCQIPVFVELAKKITKHRAPIDAALEHGLSQGLIESTNTKIRLLTRIAFGFRSPQALIALAMLALGGHRPTLPGRA
ncbi:ISL3 family transposase [Saccharopolyspora pogona]|uniref:ISL3 family transposase n=1 Tax=Saccharopolyspora pogona TaxID=333966 RepID=UPI001686C882|nr:ISL3 family transposase [Saccharopolyspora pogona]